MFLKDILFKVLLYFAVTAIITLIDLIPIEIIQKIGIVWLTKINIWLIFTCFFIGVSWLLSYRKQIKKNNIESKFNTAINQLRDSSHITRLASVHP